MLNTIKLEDKVTQLIGCGATDIFINVRNKIEGLRDLHNNLALKSRSSWHTDLTNIHHTKRSNVYTNLQNEKILSQYTDNIVTEVKSEGIRRRSGDHYAPGINRAYIIIVRNNL